MQELATNSFTYEHFPELMAMLWRRMLNENKSNYRRIYKSLILLNYLLRNGSERVVTSAREHVYDLRTLENFSYIDELGKDQGVNIRHRAKQTIEFLQDDNRLREERKKAKKNKDKYVGVSRNMIVTSSSTSSSRYMDDYDEDYSSTSSNVFKDDKEEKAKSDSPGLVRKTVTTPPKQQSSPTTTSNSSPTAIKNKTTKNYASKKVDLGAAADYAKQHQQQETTHQNSSNNNEDLINTQSNMLFDLDLIQTTDQNLQQQQNSTNNNKATTSQVTDLFDNLGLSTSISPTSAAAAEEEFADFSKFNNDQQSSKTNQEIITTTTVSTSNKDDDFADFTSFSSLPTAQQSTEQINQAQSISASSTQDDLLGLDVSSNNLGTTTNINLLTGAHSLPQMMNSNSLNTGLSSNSFFSNNTNSSSNSIPAFQADTFFTPLTPSKPSTLSFKSADQLREEEPAKQSPTASAILTKKNTWGGLTENLKIDLDNLLQSKKEKPKPSMNQLASTTTTKVNNNNINQSFAQGN